jgi:site-specific recombinase XerD
MVVNENSDTFIMFSRTKTDVRQMVFLLPEAHRIIEKYKGDRKIFSSISNQKMNNYLKELGTLCNISKELTSHVGRHTFATNMLSLGMPLESIQAMLGQANIKTTSIYTNLISTKLSNDFKRLGIDGL